MDTPLSVILSAVKNPLNALKVFDLHALDSSLRPE
jgi:hypothetical protein